MSRAGSSVGSRPLGVGPKEVVEAGDGWAADGGVVAVMVVGVEPVVEGGGAGRVVGPGRHVGPFVGQAAVEAFNLAVGLGPIRRDRPVPGAALGQGVLET